MLAGRKEKRRGGLTILLAAVTVIFLLVYARAQGTVDSPRMTQRRINEFAAALDHGVRTLVDDTGLRQRREKLTVYLHRVTVPLPNETLPDYRTRIERYVFALEAAAKATVPLHRMPTLSDTSPANQTQWERVTQSLRYLPARVKKLRGVWESQYARQTSLPTSRTLEAEFYRTLLLTLSARDGLRDARP